MNYQTISRKKCVKIINKNLHKMKTAIIKDREGKEIAKFKYKKHQFTDNGIVFLNDRVKGSNILDPVYYIPYGWGIIEFDVKGGVIVEFSDTPFDVETGGNGNYSTNSTLQDLVKEKGDNGKTWSGILIDLLQAEAEIDLARMQDRVWGVCMGKKSEKIK